MPQEVHRTILPSRTCLQDSRPPLKGQYEVVQLWYWTGESGTKVVPFDLAYSPFVRASRAHSMSQDEPRFQKSFSRHGIFRPS